jgi:hypothetical protein
MFNWWKLVENVAVNTFSSTMRFRDDRQWQNIRLRKSGKESSLIFVISAASL